MGARVRLSRREGPKNPTYISTHLPIVKKSVITFMLSSDRAFSEEELRYALKESIPLDHCCVDECLASAETGKGSSVKIAEGTHEKRAKALHRRREGCHPETDLLDKVPVSDRCDELGLPPTVFYRWQKELFENGAAAFQGKSRPDHQAEQQRIEFLEKKIQTKDEVLAELMAEHIA